MKNKINSILFILLLAAGVAVWFSPADKESLQKENRTLAPMPKINLEVLKNGKFMNEFEQFVNDNIGYRSYFTETADKLRSYKGIEPPAGKVIYTEKDIGTEHIKKACLLQLDDKIMEVFASDEEAEEIYINAVNECAAKIPESVSLYSMLIPTQLEFQQPMYKNIQTDQKATIEHIYNGLDGRIKTVDAYSNLGKHTNEYIYFRTDHHWTALGAYYAYEAFGKAAGFEPARLADFTKNRQENEFLGYLYNKAQDEELKNHQDYVEWFDIDAKNKLSYRFKGFYESGKDYNYRGTMYNRAADNYTFFFRSDHPYVKITNASVKNGKTVLLVKDSFANAFAPWLANSFENVIMVDPRSFKGDMTKIIAQDKVTDLVFMHYVFTTSFADYCKMMTNMWK